MTNLYAVDAHVHMRLQNGTYRVKADIPMLGFFIDGIKVFPPNESKGKPNWAVYPPSYEKNGEYKPVIEFKKDESLWKEIVTACIGAVTLDQESDAQDTVLDDIPDGPVDMSEIPF